VIGIFICIIAIALLLYAIIFVNGGTTSQNDKQKKAKELEIKIMADREVTLENINKVDAKTYEFDIYIQGDNFELTSYQGAIGFNQNIINGGTLTFQYLTGTCEINNPPAFGLGVNSTDGPRELTFGSGPGTDSITIKKRLGKFRLINSVNFIQTEDLNPQWNFAGVINTIFTGTGFNNITSTITFSVITGGLIMATINDSQKILLTAQPVSGKGNPAPIDGPVTWAVSVGPEFVSLTPVDDFSVYAVAIGPLGISTVEATADADLGGGITAITNTVQVEVIGGPAVTLDILPGTPEPQ